MLKTTLPAFLLASLLLLGGSPSAQAQTSFNRNWEFSAAEGNNPSYIGSENHARGLAYGRVDDGTGETVERVLVVTSAGGAYNVLVLNATDGTVVDSLDTSGIVSSSSGRTLTDVEVSRDGRIIACNEVNNTFIPQEGTENFRCYRWDSLADTPTEVINYTPPDNSDDDASTGDWIGRQFDLAGRAEDNSLTLMTAATRTSVYVYRFTTTDNGQSFSVTPIERSGRPPSGNINAVAPTEPGESRFFFNELTTAPIAYSATGSEETRDQGAFSSFTHSLKYFEVGEREWLAAFRWDSPGENQFVQLVEVTNGLDQALPAGTTPNFGRSNPQTNANGTGDVDVRINSDNSVTLFVLATNNGIGSYTTTTALPVEMTAFDAVRNDDVVELTWRTASETNNAGFHIQRAANDAAFTDIGFRAGAGTTTETQTYRFVDANVPVEAQTLRYRLRQVDVDGSTRFSPVVTVETTVPDAVQLLGSVPNPVSNQAQIRYALPQAMDVELAVFDVLGRRVATLARGTKPARKHIAQVDASNWSSGTYLVRLTAGSQVVTRQLTVLK